jgi:3-oxoacyl-[acyl-carrier-protein] synthase-3
MMSRLNAAITHIAYHLPERLLTNEQLAREFGSWDEAKITAKTGIVSRHVAAPEHCASDLGVAAARALLDSAACPPRDIDFLLFCTQSPDYLLPTTACLMHSRLGLEARCAAIDINQGCSGFVYGLALAKGLVERGIAGRVMLINSDTYTRYLNPRDRSTRTIFGDGAAATLIESVGGERSGDGDLIGPFVFGTDGSGAPNLIVPTGGLRRRPTAESSVEREDESGNWRSDDNLYMNGAEIFAFTLRAVPEAVHQLLDRAGLGRDDVDYYVFHQANKFMLERLRQKLEIPPEKFAITMEETGNTVSSSIPIALEREKSRGRVRSGDRVMLVGFGVGYSWAATMIQVL